MRLGLHFQAGFRVKLNEGVIVRVQSFESETPQIVDVTLTLSGL